MIFIHLPTLGEAAAPVVQERELWPKMLSAPVEIVGVPPRTLFAGIPAADLRRLFYDSVHFNLNGQEFFTARITPTLLHLHASQNDRPKILAGVALIVLCALVIYLSFAAPAFSQHNKVVYQGF